MVKIGNGIIKLIGSYILPPRLDVQKYLVFFSRGYLQNCLTMSLHILGAKCDSNMMVRHLILQDVYVTTWIEHLRGTMHSDRRMCDLWLKDIKSYEKKPAKFLFLFVCLFTYISPSDLYMLLLILFTIYLCLFIKKS